MRKFLILLSLALIAAVSPTTPLQLNPPKHVDHMTAAEIRQFVAAQESPREITDDPGTWPESWGDADRRVKSCSSSGHDNGKTTHGKGGTLEAPTNCACMNECIKHGVVPGTNQFAQIHGDPRCKTTCRASTCKCRPPCVLLRDMLPRPAFCDVVYSARGNAEFAAVEA